METALVADIADAGPAEFDALDRTAGAAGCYHRLRQRQADGRWSTHYLRARENGRLTAAVPAYLGRAKTWPSRHYDAATWPLPERLRDGLVPGTCLLVGGCADGRSSLHVRGDGAAVPLGRLVAELASFAAERDRCLVFPFMDARAKASLTEATQGRVVWTLLRREAHLHGVADTRWERSLGSKVNGVLRRDQRLIAAACLATSVHTWPEVEDTASQLIAAHNVRKGDPDHPEFARLRYAEWLECDGVELVVFSTAVDDVTGVLTALVWNDELELCEIGLTESESPRRLAAYLDLVFHRPLAFARSRGLRAIRAGSAAEVPKRSRGAVFEDLYGGVVDLAQTRRLAGGRT